MTNEIEKRRVRYLLTDLKEIVDLVIQRNSLFAHPENILIATITDDTEHIWDLELRRILKASHTSTTRSLRQFRLPILNFASADFTNISDWSVENIIEPSPDKRISEEELMKYSKFNNRLATELNNYPCHTQVVERFVKLVSDAPGKFADRNSGMGLVAHESVRVKACLTLKQKLNSGFKWKTIFCAFILSIAYILKESFDQFRN